MAWEEVLHQRTRRNVHFDSGLPVASKIVEPALAETWWLRDRRQIVEHKITRPSEGCGPKRGNYFTRAVIKKGTVS